MQCAIFACWDIEESLKPSNLKLPSRACQDMIALVVRSVNFHFGYDCCSGHGKVGSILMRTERRENPRVGVEFLSSSGLKNQTRFIMWDESLLEAWTWSRQDMNKVGSSKAPNHQVNCQTNKDKPSPLWRLLRNKSIPSYAKQSNEFNL